VLRKFTVAVLVLLLLLVAYLTLYPVPIDPVVWDPPEDTGYVGVHAANRRLADLRLISIGAESGPEHVLVGADGDLYAAVDGGKILRMNADGTSMEVWAQTGGRVLGFDFDGQGRMIAADAVRGLLAIEREGESAGDRKVTVLADKVASSSGLDPIRYADAVTIAADGKIYFTDASRRFGPARWGGTFNASVLDIMEHSATGRVIVYDPSNSETEVMVDGLSFANGIVLSADQSSIYVVETGEYRIWKFAVSVRGLNARDIDPAAQSPSGDARIFLANLPGYPDNLMRGLNGRIWAGLVKPRSRETDSLSDKPFVRKLAMRLPKRLWPVPPAYGHVFAFDEDGNIVADLQDPSGRYPETTGVTETPERLYIQSLHAPALGWLPNGNPM